MVKAMYRPRPTPPKRLTNSSPPATAVFDVKLHEMAPPYAGWLYMCSRSPADGAAVGFALAVPGPDAVPGTLNLLRTGLVATNYVLLLAATHRAAVWSRVYLDNDTNSTRVP